MAAVYQAIGNQSAGAASVNVAWPTHLTGDLGLMVIETGGEGTTLTVPSGWTAVTGSPVTAVASNAGSKLQVWYKFAASNAEANVATGDSGDHQVARIVTFRGIDPTTPFDVTPVTATKTTASTTVTWNAITTVTDGALIVLIATRPDDSTSTTAFSNPVNSNLTGLTERGEAGSNAGHGGGWVVVTGTKDTAGSTGTTTMTCPSVTNAEFIIALRPEPELQTLTPTLYTNSQTFYAATVTPGAVALTPGLYSNEQTFYSATVAQTGGAQDLTPALYTNNQTFYSATATASYTLLPNAFENQQTFYAPTVTTTVTLAPPLFTNSATFYAASVTQDGGPQTLLPDVYSNAQAFYAATVQTTYTLAPALYSNAGEFYAPTVTTSRDVAPGLYTNTQTFYAATVTNGGASTQELVCSDYVDTGYVEDGYVSWPAFNANVFYPPTVGKRYHEIEFVDFEPKLWWLRKPKALPEEVAQEKVQAVARTIQRVVRKKVDAQQEPSKKEVKQAIAGLVQDMPGFDWVALYQQIVLQINLQRLQDEELARQEQGRLARIRFEQDDEDALILLMAA